MYPQSSFGRSIKTALRNSPSGRPYASSAAGGWRPPWNGGMVLVDGYIYGFDQNGTAAVLKAGRSPEVVATNSLEDGFMASPAVSGRALILRTKKNLYRIESGGKAELK